MSSNLFRGSICIFIIFFISIFITVTFNDFQINYWITNDNIINRNDSIEMKKCQNGDINGNWNKDLNEWIPFNCNYNIMNNHEFSECLINDNISLIVFLGDSQLRNIHDKFKEMNDINNLTKLEHISITYLQDMIKNEMFIKDVMMRKNQMY